MKVGFYAGSFDPFTIGHLHIVKVASRIFDKVIVGIGVNSEKARRFDKTEMKEAVEKLLKSENLNNFEVILFEGLTADVAIEYGADFLIRGVRNGVDYDFEENLALINEEISGIDTIYIRAGEYGAISSSMVFELLKCNKDVSKYVPKYVIDMIDK
ncbi:MAG: pantetheine-phosphate adenylyltransferase [Clostridia bacterium]|nr:pantetheine-phosphate adenylyltransferase [Clostridia bacterium]